MLDFNEIDFSFIGNEQYREILHNDYKEALRCLNNKSYKSVVVLSGSIIESILSDFRLQKDDSVTAAKVQKMTLSHLLDYALENELIKERSSQLSNVIRNFRNLIHPGRLIRVKEKVDSNLAIAAFGVMNIILSDIKDSYDKLYKHDGQTVFRILTSDNHTLINIDLYMSEMNKGEKNELLKLIIDLIANREKNHAISFFRARHIYNQISKYYDDTTLKACVNRLYSEVKQGNGGYVINLFKCFGNILNLLAEEKKNVILKYVYNKTCLDQLFVSPPYPYVHSNIYKYLGQYHESKVEKELYYKTLINALEWYNSNDEDSENSLAFYKEFTKSLTDNERAALKDYLDKKTSKEKFEQFFSDLDPSSKVELQDDDLPF